MESETNTNRKGFLKRTGLAIASVFALSSALTAGSREGKSGSTEKTRGRDAATAHGAAAPGTEGIAASALARVRPARGAVARQREC